MGQLHFSVIVPVYNSEELIEECLESVIGQTCKNFEIIAVNDGSTDSSGTICDQLAKKDERIRVIHQANQGHVVARKNAIVEANGDYCLFLDSDDCWDSDLLETIRQAISEYGCDLIIYNYKKLSREGAVLSEPKSVFEGGTLFDKTNKRQLFEKMVYTSRLNNIWCKAVKKTILDVVGVTPPVRLRNAEDLFMSLQIIYNSKKILYIDKPLYNYRMVAGSITHAFNIGLYEDITVARGLLLHYLKVLKINTGDNLRAFYGFYVKSILKYVFMLIESNVFRNECFAILAKIIGIEMYRDAMKYVDFSCFSRKEGVLLYLLNKKNFRSLYVYGKILGVLKMIKKRFNHRLDEY